MAEQMIACGSCGKRKGRGDIEGHVCGDRMCGSCGVHRSIGLLFGSKHTCGACAAFANAHEADRDPEQPLPDVEPEVLEFVNAVVKPRRERLDTIEDARAILFGELLGGENDDGAGVKRAHYDEVARRLVEQANEYAPKSHVLGSTRTVLAAARLVDARQLADALVPVFEGGGDDGQFAEQALRGLTACFGAYKARALFKEIVRPQTGAYSGAGTPGLLHTIREERGYEDIGRSIAPEEWAEMVAAGDSTVDPLDVYEDGEYDDDFDPLSVFEDGEGDEDYDRIGARFKVPKMFGSAGTRLAYSTDQMAETIVREYAHQESVTPPDNPAINFEEFGRKIAEEADAFDKQGAKQSPVGEGELTTQRKWWILFLKDLKQSTKAATIKDNKAMAAARKALMSRLRRNRNTPAEPTGPAWMAKYSSRQANYKQFWDNLYQMFYYWRKGFQSGSFVRARADPSRTATIVRDLQHMANTATKLIAPLHEGNTVYARMAVDEFVHFAVERLLQQAQASSPSSDE
jgi:hypothetical protein